MTNKYVAIDVETPNTANNRICSIGITTIVDNTITKTINYFVNPECAFDSICIRIHGITATKVKSAPSFPDVWKEIKPLFDGRIILAHNAKFDLSVLSKTLLHYGIIEAPIRFIDTLEMSRCVYPEVNCHKLRTLCECFDINLTNHDSGSDSAACAELFCKMVEEGKYADDYIKIYELDSTKVSIPKCDDRAYSIPSDKHQSFGLDGAFVEISLDGIVVYDDADEPVVISEHKSPLLELKEIIEEISDDGFIDKEELALLTMWLESHQKLKSTYPYNEIIKTIDDICEDGIITTPEMNKLLCVLHKVVNPLDDCVCSCQLSGVAGKAICLSGDFRHGSKEEVAKLLEGEGAIIQNSVTKKTDIVLVGDLGSEHWAAGNYGTKIKRAMELQSKGVKIEIIKESNFFNTREQK